MIFKVMCLFSPTNPDSMDWSSLYPDFIDKNDRKLLKPVEFADIGCGYGGLLGKRTQEKSLGCLNL